MDPVNTDCKEILVEKDEIRSSLMENFPIINSIHDFRIVGDGEVKNLIFDIVVGYDKSLNSENLENLKEDVNKFILEKHPELNIVITIDRNYIL
jgi:divalent metal cation (Fe/Co/Zn/Cd) transporter